MILYLIAKPIKLMRQRGQILIREKLETPVATAQGKINGNGGMAVQGGNGATFNR